MTESRTPICDLIASLIAKGQSPGDAVDIARPVEASLRRGASLTDEERRAKWTAKKARQRAAKKARLSPGDTTPGLSSSGSKVPESLKKEGKKESGVPLSPRDDWPDGYAELFWTAFPPARRYDKAQVYRHLEKLRADGFVNADKKRERLTWATLWSGLERYVNSKPGEFAKAPLPWLRAHRWQWAGGGGDGGKSNREGGRNGGADAVAVAAARRFGGGGRGGPAPGTADSVSSSDRMGDERPGARGGGQPSFDLDLKPEPGGSVRNPR